MASQACKPYTNNGTTGAYAAEANNPSAKLILKTMVKRVFILQAPQLTFRHHNNRVHLTLGLVLMTKAYLSKHARQTPIIINNSTE